MSALFRTAAAAPNDAVLNADWITLATRMSAYSGSFPRGPERPRIEDAICAESPSGLERIESGFPGPQRGFCHVIEPVLTALFARHGVSCGYCALTRTVPASNRPNSACRARSVQSWIRVADFNGTNGIAPRAKLLESWSLLFSPEVHRRFPMLDAHTLISAGRFTPDDSTRMVITRQRIADRSRRLVQIVVPKIAASLDQAVYNLNPAAVAANSLLRQYDLSPDGNPLDENARTALQTLEEEITAACGTKPLGVKVYGPNPTAHRIRAALGSAKANRAFIRYLAMMTVLRPSWRLIDLLHFAVPGCYALLPEVVFIR